MRSADKEQQPKKPYTSPVLTVYGTVQNMTQGTGTQGSRDNPRSIGRTSV
jgi:hypothetical protein